jgi:hypothetical protein
MDSPTPPDIFNRIALHLKDECVPRRFGLHFVGNYTAVNTGREVYTLSNAELRHCLEQIGIKDGDTVVMDLEKQQAVLMDLPIFMWRLLQDGNRLGLQ